MRLRLLTIILLTWISTLIIHTTACSVDAHTILTTDTSLTAFFDYSEPAIERQTLDAHNTTTTPVTPAEPAHRLVGSQSRWAETLFSPPRHPWLPARPVKRSEIDRTGGWSVAGAVPAINEHCGCFSIILSSLILIIMFNLSEYWHPAW